MFAQRFSPTPRGARLARLLAEHQFAVWGVPRGTAVHDAAVLVVAELAANAVLHGRVPGRDFELALGHEPAGGVLRVEVSDTHPSRPLPLVRPAAREPEGERGRGLPLVAAVADRWGVRERCGPGKTVWAELRTGGPALARAFGGPTASAGGPAGSDGDGTEAGRTRHESRPRQNDPGGTGGACPVDAGSQQAALQEVVRFGPGEEAAGAGAQLDANR
ncbi:ATP-binding protein [Streptomyces sp. TRM 70361]|uniref:ATP-binding protein n=1 Tax=Streptomyces sp. TRM 70361 TaxID=3116553 RepID=UPI002E7BDA15|nr:ATP-binding protein [Streptomyces sp. TRM 70361]MEE1938023.1 ATP-binding protein [Streptomyces sp. TRM 70361]